MLEPYELQNNMSKRYGRYCPAEHNADDCTAQKQALMHILLDAGATGWHELGECAVGLSKATFGSDSAQTPEFRLTGEFDLPLREFMVKRWWSVKALLLLMAERGGHALVGRLPVEVWRRILLDAKAYTLQDCVANTWWADYKPDL